MSSVADALRQHAPAYLEKYGERVPLIHRKVLMAIMRCRTGELGSLIYQCKSCLAGHWVGRSCGNRRGTFREQTKESRSQFDGCQHDRTDSRETEALSRTGYPPLIQSGATVSSGPTEVLFSGFGTGS